MKLPRGLVWGFWRYLGAAAAILLLSWLGLPDAAAQSRSCRGPADQCDQGQALSFAKAARDKLCVYGDYTTCANKSCTVIDLGGGHGQYTCVGQPRADNGGTGPQVVETAYFIKGCATRASTPTGWVGQGISNACDSGCAFASVQPIESKKVDVAGGALDIQIKGTWVPTGSTCDAGDPKPVVKDDFCTDAGGGYQICPGKRGNCVTSARTGRTYCPGSPDAGMTATSPDRTEGVTQSPNSPAPGTPPSAIVPRPGETIQPIVTATTTSTKNNPGGGSTTNVTNTTINNIDNGNTNPGDGVDGDGSGDNGDGGDGDGEGDKEGDGDGPTLSGGMSCDVPPACSINDDAACKTAMIMWQFQCGNSQEAGSEAAAASASVAALELQWDEDSQTYGAGALQAYDDARSALASDVIDVDGSDMMDLLDGTGFLGAGTCPVLPQMTVAGVDITANLGPICDLFAGLGLLVEALAYFAALRIITRG